jgi:hypothetical protein
VLRDARALLQWPPLQALRPGPCQWAGRPAASSKGSSSGSATGSQRLALELAEGPPRTGGDVALTRRVRLGPGRGLGGGLAPVLDRPDFEDLEDLLDNEGHLLCRRHLPRHRLLRLRELGPDAVRRHLRVLAHHL